MTGRATTRRVVPRGFTLVEVLATLMLAAIVLPAVMRGLSVCLATSGQARQQAEATVLAQDKLSEVIATGQLQQAALSGDFGTDWPGYLWEVRVDDFDTTTLRQVEVTVSWNRGGQVRQAAQAGQDRSVTLTSLVYTGTASDTSTGTGTSSGTGTGGAGGGGSP